jgi:RHS repeat-associated protein
MDDGTGTTTYSYDRRNRVLVKATPEGTLMYTYDAAGNRLSMRSDLPGGINMGYAWDANERLSGVADNSSGGGATIYSYDSAGNLGRLTFPNNIQTAYTYDNLNRLTNLVATNTATSAAVASFQYTLGPTGNRASVTEASGRTVSWSYDSQYRVTNETISGTAYTDVMGSVGYTYDAVGNRLSRTSVVAGVTTQSSISYDSDDRFIDDNYNANGDVLQSNSTTYLYDFEDRLTSSNGGEQQFAYDGDGNRVAKVVVGVDGATATTYLIDDDGPSGFPQGVEERSVGAVQKAYAYGLGLISWRDSSGDSRFYTADGSMNVRMLTDGSGHITDTWDYDGFGTVLTRTGSTANQYLFSGEYNDADLGFVYLRARWLKKDDGRFRTRDTRDGNIGDPPTLNTYGYATQDPINEIDPSGHDATIAEETPKMSGIAILAMAILATAGVLAYEQAIAKEREVGPAQIRTQIQSNVWEFSAYATNWYFMGVTVVQGWMCLWTTIAQTPGRVHEAAAPALLIQKAWIATRPANRGVPGGGSHSVPIVFTGVKDPRFDVESIRGTNFKVPW